MMRQPRIENGAHLDFIRGLACVLCGDDTATEAAHVRFSDATVDKRQTGMSEKPSDCFTVPLCGRCHRDQHTMNEREFWGEIDPIKLALALWRVSGDHAAGQRIVQATRVLHQ